MYLLSIFSLLFDLNNAHVFILVVPRSPSIYFSSVIDPEHLLLFSVKHDDEVKGSDPSISIVPRVHHSLLSAYLKGCTEDNREMIILVLNYRLHHWMVCILLMAYHTGLFDRSQDTLLE
ncbi:hypothetical protein BDB01DRAFT_835349 [Pilobolus umbonatus]|nr:hypothetical protein BDB01DRAFT_835349 [Pilobolus umbonatus]